ncbi:unnamed protein product [Prunus armeniaca]
MRCPDEDRVQLAAFLLKRNVYHWWKTIRKDYADPTSITWVEFLTGPAPNFPEPETNPAETPASHPRQVHSLKLCPLLPERI